MNILITGIHGFVGSKLVELISTGNTVYGVDIVAPFVNNISDTFSWNDVDNGKIPAADAIIHLAGISHECRKKSEEQSYIDVNYGLTKKIYDNFLAGDAGVFIFFSSVKAVTDTLLPGVRLTEETPASPKDIYGISKSMAEKYIMNNLPDAQSGKKVYILRPCMIYGPDCKGNFRLLYSYVKSGLPWFLVSFDNNRSFTSIDNVCYIVSRLTAGNAATGIYNVCDDESFSTNQLIDIISRILDKKMVKLNISAGFISFFAKAGSLLKLPFNSDRLKKLTENYPVSNVKIKSALDIDEMPYKATDSLRKAVLSFENSGK